MDDEIESQVTDEINRWIDDHIENIRRDRPGWLQELEEGLAPFKNVFFSRDMFLSSKFERRLSTSGGSLHEKLAAIIARPKYNIVEQQHLSSGLLSDYTVTEISNIVHLLETDGRNKNYNDRVAALPQSLGDLEDRINQRNVISDLYLESDTCEHYFEIKAPKPNKDQCMKMIQKSLEINCIRAESERTVHTWIGMTFNPFGDHNEYRHDIADKYLDVAEQVRIGSDFWEIVGDADTYDDLVKIFRRIANDGGREKLREVVCNDPTGDPPDVAE